MYATVIPGSTPTPLVINITATMGPIMPTNTTTTKRPIICRDLSRECHYKKFKCRWNANVRRNCPKTCELCESKPKICYDFWGAFTCQWKRFLCSTFTIRRNCRRTCRACR
ncbi:unnamed protein product [Lepeophtheirus salmonis]|uniref:(salmon louse) hypothetical protein n=1 Tax=Lepeophtheirus salmonis TaxID=72036 RepID=A0A7R8H070_LEPSM|nr:unnamed protein product [Lepeophtheirus salmonis]CAF2764193.1 unnamed protein product [Lepeophtheirus salmonis]